MDEKDFEKRIEVVIRWLNTAKELLEEDYEVAFDNVTRALIELKKIQKSMNEGK